MFYWNHRWPRAASPGISPRPPGACSPGISVGQDNLLFDV